MAGEVQTTGRDVALIADNADLNEEILRNLNAFIKDKEAFADNTWNQFMITVRQWCQWCLAKGRPYLPVEAEYMRDYLWELHERGLAPTTIRSCAAMLNLLHRQAGLIPAGDSQQVKRVLKKIHRLALVRGEQAGQAIPFRIADLNRLEAVWQDSTQLKDVRNLAFLFVAYNTLLRVSNLGRLKVSDVMGQRDGSVLLNVGYTKTIMNGQGVVKALSPRAAVRLLAWLEMSGLSAHPDAYVFCRVHRSNQAVVTTAAPMSNRALIPIFAEAWAVVHGEYQQDKDKGRYATWTGHSARVGAAQDMTESGYSLAQIMHEGTWTKPETVLGYIRNLEAKKSVMNELVEGHTDE
ncbi:tyrosine-type recombinase/integrase (plasmid) [Xenorhabdus stockiae]|uniref:tyrosine-type recombinase/integrase n=1 Tax=Xenorhabdus stockiae TaxID=351614 RepID=UPI003CFB87E3